MVKDGQIYIRGYPRDTKEDSLREAFTEFGDIIEVKMVTPAYSFITYQTVEQAQLAVEKMDGQQFQNSTLIVEIAGVKKTLTGPKPDDVCRSCGGKGHWYQNHIKQGEIAVRKEGNVLAIAVEDVDLGLVRTLAIATGDTRSARIEEDVIGPAAQRAAPAAAQVRAAAVLTEGASPIGRRSADRRSLRIAEARQHSENSKNSKAKRKE